MPAEQQVYLLLTTDSDPDAVQKIVTALSIKVPPRELKSKDSRSLLTLIMQQWLPLSAATFQAVIEVVPPPPTAQAARVPFMIHPNEAAASSSPLQPQNEIERGLYACDQSADAPVVGYVSKMFAVARGDLPQNKAKQITAEEMRERGRQERERRAALKANGSDASAAGGVPLADTEDLSGQVDKLNLDGIEPAAEIISNQAESSEVLLGFSRIFSGVLRRGATLFATLPKYDTELGPSHPKNAKYLTKVEVSALYMMMGRDLTIVDEVPAGQVCAIAGLDGKVFRNATLIAPSAAGVKDDDAPSELINLAGVSMQAAPIVRVALEPENPSKPSRSRRPGSC